MPLAVPGVKGQHVKDRIRRVYSIAGPIATKSASGCQTIINSVPYIYVYIYIPTKYLIKSEYSSEQYINKVSCRAQAKLRGGSAPLEIETRRYVGTLIEQRIYKLCHQDVEGEAHFIL